MSGLVAKQVVESLHSPLQLVLLTLEQETAMGQGLVLLRFFVLIDIILCA